MAWIWNSFLGSLANRLWQSCAIALKSEPGDLGGTRDAILGMALVEEEPFDVDCLLGHGDLLRIHSLRRLWSRSSRRREGAEHRILYSFDMMVLTIVRGRLS